MNTYTEVMEALRQLPQPRDGYVRVFRGQPKDYRTEDDRTLMLPTGLRKSSLKHTLAWSTYSRGLAFDMLRLTGADVSSNRITIDQESIFTWWFWVQAIVQHYGPGSQFLDVTHRIEVALWFALHEAVASSALSVNGPPGPPNPSGDIPIESTVVQYVWSRQRSGWLYVFDVKKYDGSVLDHGTLIDLADAAPTFASSPRVHAQRACLLWADSKHDGGNLGTLCVTPKPLAVEWPLAGAPPLVTVPVEELFPPPGEDSWYARLLGVPAVLTPRPDGSACYFRRALETPEYLPEKPKQEQLQDFSRRIISVAPQTLYQAIRSIPAASPKDIVWDASLKHTFARATPIYFEGPIWTLTPPAESGAWNEGLLAADIDDHVSVYDLATGTHSASVPLENVFIEFSPLEKVGWERIEQSGERIEFERGMWLARHRGEIAITLFVQTLPGDEIMCIGPLLVAYDEPTHCLRTLKGGQADEPVLRFSALVAKALYTALPRLRDLSQPWKFAPYPTREERAGEGSDEILGDIRIARAITHLVTCNGSRGYCFLRTIGTDEPYLGPGSAPRTAPHITMRRLRYRSAFAAADAEALRRYLRSELSN